MEQDTNVQVSLDLLERLWLKLDNSTDEQVDSDTWRSKELIDLTDELERILRENGSTVPDS